MQVVHLPYYQRHAFICQELDLAMHIGAGVSMSMHLKFTAAISWLSLIVACYSARLLTEVGSTVNPFNLAILMLKILASI